MRILVVDAVRLSFVWPERRFDDLETDEAPDNGDQECTRYHEIPVRTDVDGIARVDEPRGLLGNTRQQRIDRPDQEIGAVAARHAGESGCQARERVPAQGIEHDGCQRHQDYVAHFRSGVRQDAAEHYDDGYDARRRVENHAPYQRRQPAAPLGYADTQQGDEYGSEWRELHEVADEVQDDQPQALGIHVTYDFDKPVLGPAPRAHRARVDDRDVEEAEYAAQHDDAGSEERKQRHGMRQSVTQPLDDVQEACNPGLARWRGGLVSHGGCIPASLEGPIGNGFWRASSN